MATGLGGHNGPPSSQEPKESQQPPPVPSYPSSGPNYYPSSTAPPPLPPRSGYAPPPLGFRPPPPPPMGVRPPLGTRPPPPPVELRPPTNPTSCSGVEDPPTTEHEETKKKSTNSQNIQEANAGGTVSRSRWDKKDDGKVETTKNEKPDGGRMKIKMGLGKRPGVGSISMKIKSQFQGDAAKKPKLESAKQVKRTLVAQAFGSDSDDEEEMPPEAKMRMRNVGSLVPRLSEQGGGEEEVGESLLQAEVVKWLRNNPGGQDLTMDTPTSAGPNSFYKTAKGFTDPRASWRNELEND